MKKALSLILVLCLVFALAACGAKNEAPAADNTDTEETFKFGLICLHDENSPYDLNFLNCAKEACDNLGVELIYKMNVEENMDAYDTACDFVDKGCSVIMADSFNHESFIMMAAEEFPDVEFLHATGTQAHVAQLANYHNAFADIYQGRYLAGIVAGLKLNEMIDAGTITADQAKMGYVGAYTYAEVISGYTSFFLGARSVCPSVTMEVQFTGSWYNEALEKEAAQALIDNGCVLISQHADSMGAPTACEQAGVPNVAYNGSTFDSCPETFLVSSRINWVPFIEYAITCTMNGEAMPYDYYGTIENGDVELSDLGTAVAEGTEDAIKAAIDNLKSGAVHVYDVTTFTVDGAQLDENTLADIDGDFTPDTAVVVDGYYAESDPAFRSAPYFNLMIDGITLLNTNFGE